MKSSRPPRTELNLDLLNRGRLGLLIIMLGLVLEGLLILELVLEGLFILKLVPHGLVVLGLLILGFLVLSRPLYPGME